MRIFICTNHDNFLPIGSDSVVLAKDKKQAQELLDKALLQKGLKPYAKMKYELHEISKSGAYFIHDGGC